jgi:predicted NBD/HSP70 family sugar kinase
MTDTRARVEGPLGPPDFGLKTPAAVDIFTRILTHGPIGRVDITRQTGLSQAAVTKAVTPLIDAGFVRVDDTQPSGSTMGRPVRPLEIVPTSILAIGIKVAVDEVVGVTTTLDARIVQSVHRALSDTSPASVVDAVVEVAEWLVAETGDASGRLVGVGVAVSGDVDTVSGVVRDSPLLGWQDFPLGDALRSRIGRPVRIDNDVHALTIAENWFGVGVDSRSFAIVTIGSGIGCGLFLNGDVVEGSFGVAGEIGHLPLASPNVVCPCGRRGCVEAVASSGAILDAVREAHDDPGLAFDDVLALAHAGDSAAVAVFDRAGDLLGRAIATMVNLVGPDIVLVAGESVGDFDLFEAQLRSAFAAHAFGAAGRCTIVTTQHTFDDWARGAAVSVIRSSIRQSSAGDDGFPQILDVVN